MSSYLRDEDDFLMLAGKFQIKIIEDGSGLTDYLRLSKGQTGTQLADEDVQILVLSHVPGNPCH